MFPYSQCAICNAKDTMVTYFIPSLEMFPYSQYAPESYFIPSLEMFPYSQYAILFYTKGYHGNLFYTIT